MVKKSVVTKRDKPDNLNRERRQEISRTRVPQPGSTPIFNEKPTSSDFWERLVVKWHHLSFKAKVNWVLLGLLCTGLTLVAAYYLLPIMIASLNQRANEIAKAESACEGFTTVRGDPYSAKVIFLGESHRERLLANSCLEKLAAIHKDKGTILLEGVPAEQEVSCQDFDAPQLPDFVCKGWDSPEFITAENSRLLQESYNVLLKELEDIFHGNQFDDKKMDAFINEINNNAQAKLENFKQAPGAAYVNSKKVIFSKTDIEFSIDRVQASLLKRILKLRRKNMLYTNIFKKLKKSLRHVDIHGPSLIKDPNGKIGPNWKLKYEKKDEEFIAGMRGRQESLIETVRAAYKDAVNNKKFVVVRAGLYHLFFSSNNPDKDSVDAVLEETITKLEEDCPETTCATLVSNAFIKK